MRSNDRWSWVTPCLTLLRSLAGFGDLAWEFGVDHLHHWPPTFVLAFWLLGGPVEALISLITSGRIQVNVKRGEQNDEDNKS